MATSPNFNWPEPDNTDLVKNGALAIRTAVNAIDTSMAELKGGTTGQVLSKTSATDMDFTWTTPSTATGYANNGALNSAFQIFQRGTSTSVAASSSPYVADRWQAATQANQASTYSQQSTNDTTNLPNIQYCIRVQRNSGQTGTGTINLAQSFETINSRQFAGKQVTLSFYARKGANYSQSGDGLGAYVYTGTGTDQNVITGYTGGAIPLSTSTTLTSTWQRFQATATLGATITELGIRFQYDPTGTAGANDYFEITGVQLELGSTATSFHTYAGTIQEELEACQRYYYRQIAPTTSTVFGNGWASSTTVAKVQTFAPATMRVAPTSVDYANIQLWDGGATYTITSFGLEYASQNTLAISAGVSSATLTAYRPCAILSTSTSGYIGFSAEL